MNQKQQQISDFKCTSFNLANQTFLEEKAEGWPEWKDGSRTVLSQPHFTVKINGGERCFGFLFQKPRSAGEDVISTAAPVVRTSLTSSHVMAFHVFLVNHFQLQFVIFFFSQFSLVIYFIHSSVYIGERNATHSSILTWEIQWTEELGGVQSVGSQRVGYY